jgi:hypothetical protein
MFGDSHYWNNDGKIEQDMYPIWNRNYSKQEARRLISNALRLYTRKTSASLDEDRQALEKSSERDWRMRTSAPQGLTSVCLQVVHFHHIVDPHLHELHTKSYRCGSIM